jgi:hypothetical protein
VGVVAEVPAGRGPGLEDDQIVEPRERGVAGVAVRAGLGSDGRPGDVPAEPVDRDDVSGLVNGDGPVVLRPPVGAIDGRG